MRVVKGRNGCHDGGKINFADRHFNRFGACHEIFSSISEKSLDVWLTV